VTAAAGESSPARGKTLRDELEMASYGSFNEDAMAVWDFVRCQRPDGTFYGSPSGRCKKGKVVADKEERASKPKKSVKPAAPKEEEEDVDTKYERLMEMAKAKFKEADRVMARDDREAAKRLRDEARDLTTEAVELKYFSGKSAPSPVKPVTPKEAPLPPKPKSKDKPKLSAPDAEKTLRNYILGGSMETGSMLETNMKLRGLAKTKITSEEQEQVKAVDRLLDTLPRNKGQTHYRGIYLDPVKDKTFIESIKKGGTIRDNGFSSYSRDQEQAEQFADQGIGKPFIIVSRSPELRDVRKYAPEEYDDQAESIMPRGTPLKINRTQVKDGITYVFTD
jgi:hypothetical protein